MKELLLCMHLARKAVVCTKLNLMFPRKPIPYCALTGSLCQRICGKINPKERKFHARLDLYWADTPRQILLSTSVLKANFQMHGNRHYQLTGKRTVSLWGLVVFSFVRRNDT